MDVDLFIKKIPRFLKELISREAAGNRRSVNQEAIALLEEALVHRVGSQTHQRRSARAILERFVSSGQVPETAPGELTDTGPGALPGARMHELPDTPAAPINP